MRKIHFLLLISAGSLLAIASCKKRLIPRPLEFCHISGVTVTVNGSPDTSFYQLTYDSEGRIIGLQSSGAVGASTKTYSYADTNLVVKTTSGGVVMTDSITLSSLGLMLVDVNRISSSPNWLTTYYYYSGSEVTSASLWYNGQTPVAGDYYGYTWNDGNLENFIPQDGLTSTTSTSYSYNSSPAAVGDYFSITQLLSAPAPTVRTTDQVDQYFQNYGTSSVGYSQYPNGRISGMTIITSGPAAFGYGAPDTVVYSYQYQCEFLVPILEKN
jgi:hypothetical protein